MTSFSDHAILPSKEPIHHTFAVAMMNEFVSNLVFKGIQGTQPSNIDFFDISLSTIQSGVSRISYKAAVETIALFNEDFKKIKEDPKNKSQTIVYLAGGSLGALYAPGINYPIDCIREFRNKKNKKFEITFKGAETFYADRVFSYIGFATSMGKFVPLLPKPKNHIQNYFLIQMSRFNGVLTAYPYKMIKYNVEFVPYVKNCLTSFAIKMISSDLSCKVQKGIYGS